MSEQTAATNAALQNCKTTFQVTMFRHRMTKQVLFLEAGKDFVDTLFSFLLLPVGTTLHVLSQGLDVKPRFGGGLSAVFRSVSSSILRVDKQELLQSRPAFVGCTCGSGRRLQVHRDLEAANLLRSPPPDREFLRSDYYRCTFFECKDTLLSSDRGERCEPCKSQGYTGHFSHGPYVVQKKDTLPVEVDHSEGFVKENIKFIVTDNLEIVPSTTKTILSLLRNTSDNTAVDEPESNEVTVNITQMLQLLHSALTSNTCLDDVFGLKK